MTDFNESTVQTVATATTPSQSSNSTDTAQAVCTCSDASGNVVSLDITGLNLEKGTGKIVIRNASNYAVVETIAIDSDQIVIRDQTISIHLTTALDSHRQYVIEVDASAIRGLSEAIHLNLDSQRVASVAVQAPNPSPETPSNSAQICESETNSTPSNPGSTSGSANDLTIPDSSVSNPVPQNPDNSTTIPTASTHDSTSTSTVPSGSTVTSPPTPIKGSDSTRVPSQNSGSSDGTPTSAPGSGSLPVQPSESSTATPSVVDAASNQASQSTQPLPSNNVPTPIQGTAGADQISGTDNGDRILARAGNDCVDAGAGNDQIVAGIGNDQIKGGAGNDVLEGGAGHDRLTGGAGNDILVGGQDSIRCAAEQAAISLSSVTSV